MARFKIRFLMEAADELESAANWYSRERPEFLPNWRLAIRETLNAIRESPKLWAPDSEGVRSVRVGKYSYEIVYKLHRDVIEIVAIAHTSRRPGYWRKRLKRR